MVTGSFVEMPTAKLPRAASGHRRPRARPRPSRVRLRMPVMGLESEFNVYIDGVEVDPRKYWRHPLAFIDRPLLRRERSSFQLPTGGAVYFDRGVIEVVTPVIELAPGCTARGVRNLWEQIGFVRQELTGWQGRTGHHVRLKAYSTHYNVSFELPRSEQGPDRNVRSLALLLAYILPVPISLIGTNRRSTGVGVRPRGNRIEVTADFTPDAGLMIATATLVVGVVREVMSWPSYALSVLDERPIPTVAGVVPGKHTTRRGWLAKDFHFPQSPFTCDVDAPIWHSRDGRLLSLRAMAREVAWYFRHSIRRYSDPFSFRLLFGVLDGRVRSLLELADRPAAYDDVGRLCRWGMVISALTAVAGGGPTAAPALNEHVGERQHERERFQMTRPRASRRSRAVVVKPKPNAIDETRLAPGGPVDEVEAEVPVLPSPLRLRDAVRRDRRRAAGYAARARGRAAERRAVDRRTRFEHKPFPDRRLSRSAYEKVFLKLVSGGRLRLGRDTYTPVGMKGWYQAIFRRDSDGRERLLSIDQLLVRMDAWES
jgi:hypothetical protein